MKTYRVSTTDGVTKLADAFNSVKGENANVFMCIGTDKVLTDSLGPRIGKVLNNEMQTPIFVYGMEQSNITAENLVNSYEFIKKMHPDSKIVVIDAGVGEKRQIGEIQISDCGIKPGSATNKNLPEIGDISIVGIVAEIGLSDFYVSNSVKLKLVDNLTQLISKGIIASTNRTV